jgi:hypothetical protein
MDEYVTQRSGFKAVTNWQKECIRNTYVCGNRRESAKMLDIPVKTLDDLLWRAYKVLGVRCLADAYAKINIERMKDDVEVVE